MSAGTESDDNIPVFQICHKSGHTANACWHRYIENYVPQSRHFGRGRGPKSAYMTTFDSHAEFAPYFDDFYAMNCSNYQSYNLDPVTYSSMPHCSSEMSSAPGAAYLANFEGPADEGWYLNSGATHHLTNNMVNMQVREEFNGSD